MKRFGALEAGGTKMVCAVSDAELNLKGSAVFPTTTPEETIAEMINYFRKFDNRLKANQDYKNVSHNNVCKKAYEIIKQYEKH